MALGVVDTLEVVDVAQDDAHGAALAPLAGEGVADDAVEVAPVAEAREGVFARLALDLLQQPALLRVGLAQGAHEPLELVVGLGQLDVAQPVDLALFLRLFDLEAHAQSAELHVGGLVEEFVADAAMAWSSRFT